MKTLLVITSLILALFNQSTNAQTLSAKDLADFRNATVYSCVKNQKKMRINAGISDVDIERYCICSSRLMLPNNLDYETAKEINMAVREANPTTAFNTILKRRGLSLDEITYRCSMALLE